MVRYDRFENFNLSYPEQPESLEPPKRYLIRKILLVLLLLVILFALYIGYNLLKYRLIPLVLGHLKAKPKVGLTPLVLGIGDPGHAGENLSDTIMVVSIEPQSHKAALISIPRDLRVNIPGYGYAKINQANSDGERYHYPGGGAKLAEQTITDNLGLPIHYYALTNFNGLKSLVDAVGGVDITVTERLYDPEYPCDNNQYAVCGLDIEPGHYHMNGTLALQYARCRKGTCGNDFGRALRQQEVLSQIREKAFKWQNFLNPLKLSLISETLGNNLKTDLTTDNLIELGLIWRQITPDRTQNVVLSTQPGNFLKSSGTSDLVPVGGNFNQIQNYLQNIFN